MMEGYMCTRQKLYLLLISIFCLILSNVHAGDYNVDAIDTIKLTDSDIPNGFIYGKIPDFARKTLKNNPWMMDKAAIKRLAKEIYPGGDFNKIAGIHSTIIANNKKPYNDDIVCYIILFHNSRLAASEMKKINDYIEYNRDRMIEINRDNIVVLMHVDDIRNYPLLKRLASMIENRLKRY
jgi:hypothetical protein